MARQISLRSLHSLNARLLLVFIAAHLVAHLMAVFGPDAQQAALDLQRPVYRARIIEPVLIALFVGQVGLGLVLLLRRFGTGERTAWSWVQMASGAYLAVFILNHILLGILMARMDGSIETGFYFAAATVVTAPAKYGFIPYYGLGIIALFAHLAAALHWRGHGRGVTLSLVGVGIVCAVAIVGAYAGLFYAIELPPEYASYMDGLF